MLDHDIRDAERERAVGTGPHAQPQIGLAREPDMARIDHNQPHAALQCLDRRGRVREAGVARVITPQNQAAGVRDIRHRAAAAHSDAGDAIGVARRKGAPPAADVECDRRIRRAEGISEPLDKAAGISNRGG